MTTHHDLVLKRAKFLQHTVTTKRDTCGGEALLVCDGTRTICSAYQWRDLWHRYVEATTKGAA